MRTNLELFVLAMVRQGVSTPYELKTKAGLSLGSTVPALARLEKDALIKASEEGARRSRKYSITAKGIKVLTQGWTEQLTARPRDMDSILRIAYLAWLNGDRAACANFMEHSARGLQGWATGRTAEADRLYSMIKGEPDGDAFMWLRTYCEAGQAGAEAEALVALSGRIKKKSNQPKRESSGTQRKLRT